MNAFQRMLHWLEDTLRAHWLALLILVVPINWVIYQSDAANVFPLLPLPIVAFAIGLWLRPRHVWVVWLGSVVIQWIVMGLWGKYDDPGDETAFSLIIEAFLWMLFGVLLPVWFGRLLRAGIEEGRHPDQAPTA